MIFDAIKNELEKGGAVFDEDIIINCIKSKKIVKDDIDVLLNIMISKKIT